MIETYRTQNYMKCKNVRWVIIQSTIESMFPVEFEFLRQVVDVLVLCFSDANF